MYFKIYKQIMCFIIFIFIIIIIRDLQCNARIERLSPYQSEDPVITIPTHGKKEEKLKT